jgi:hypothetical protein
MSVARISSPQLLDATLRTTQQAIDQERVGVGADLRRDPASQPDERPRQSFAQAEDPLETRKKAISIRCLTPPGRLCACSLWSRIPTSEEGLLEIFAAVGEVPKKAPRHTVSESRLLEEFFGESELRDVVGGRELVGDRYPVGSSTDEVELDSFRR